MSSLSFSGSILKIEKKIAKLIPSKTHSQNLK
jgi:hypothetical protein